MLVDKFRLPLPSKMFVSTGVHWFNGKAMFVLMSSQYVPPAEPFMAEIVSIVPLKPMLVICGDDGAMMASGARDLTVKEPLPKKLPP
jgi:hypothetical protein